MICLTDVSENCWDGMNPDWGLQNSWVASLSADTEHLPQHHCHSRANLFGKQTPSLSLASRGPVRVRRSLFNYWGRQGWSKEKGEGQGLRSVWLHGPLLRDVTDCESLASQYHVWYTVEPLLPLMLSSWAADRCWTRLNEILMSESNMDWVLLGYRLHQNKDNCCISVCICFKLEAFKESSQVFLVCFCLWPHVQFIERKGPV